MAQVIMYSSRLCPFCFRAKALLTQKNVQLEERIVDGEPALREQMMAESGRHTVPQIWVGEVHVGGCDDLVALESSGKLDQMLA